MSVYNGKIGQIADALTTKFLVFLPQVSNIGRQKWTDVDWERFNTSRCLAAYAIQQYSKISNQKAAESVIDDYGDNGIDAIYYNEVDNLLIAVQSKFKESETISHVDTLSFLKGVELIIQREYSSFNSLFQNNISTITRALGNPNIKLLLVLIQIKNSVSSIVERDIRNKTAVLNHDQAWVSYEINTLDQIFSSLLTEYIVNPINCSISFCNWNISTAPFRVLYGQVNASALRELYQLHKDKLFIWNIRNYLGSTDVNSAIDKTINTQPCNLFCMNNGITAICSSFAYPGAATRDTVSVTIQGFSVINGAQTLGTIGRSSAVNEDLDRANVLFTIIELQEQHSNLYKEITYSRNFQNTVQQVNYASLDDTQERIRQSLALSGINYLYKPTLDNDIVNDTNIRMQDAAVAIACFSQDLNLSVIAKKEIGRVWDRFGQFYDKIFHDDTNHITLYRSVLIYRYIIRLLNENEKATLPNTDVRFFYRHLRFFTLHILGIRKRALINIDAISLTTDELEELSRELFEIVSIVMDEARPLLTYKGYLAISKNLTDCSQLKDRVMKRLYDRVVAERNENEETET